MSPETNVEYATSPDFPVLHTKYHDFFPGQVPGKSMVIYESRQSVLGGYDPQCILVRNDGSGLTFLYPSSEHSQGRLLSGPKYGHGYYFWVSQKGEEVRVLKMSGTGGFGKDLWFVRGSKIERFESRISSKKGIAVIPVISEYPDRSCLVLCDQTDLAEPATQKFIEGLLAGEKVLPSDRTRMDIPALPEAEKV